MGKSKKKKHFLENDFDVYRKVRKPKCKPSRVIKERNDPKSSKRKFDWREDIDG
jgi:hypothetical protein